jgi:hypothetical protein
VEGTGKKYVMKGKRLRYKRDRGKEERGHGIKI